MKTLSKDVSIRNIFAVDQGNRGGAIQKKMRYQQQNFRNFRIHVSLSPIFLPTSHLADLQDISHKSKMSLALLWFPPKNSSHLWNLFFEK